MAHLLASCHSPYNPIVKKLSPSPQNLLHVDRHSSEYIFRLCNHCLLLLFVNTTYFIPSYVRLQRNKVPLIGIVSPMVNFHYSRVLQNAITDILAIRAISV
jgi:hypothetical protein